MLHVHSAKRPASRALLLALAALLVPGAAFAAGPKAAGATVAQATPTKDAAAKPTPAAPARSTAPAKDEPAAQDAAAQEKPAPAAGTPSLSEVEKNLSPGLRAALHAAVSQAVDTQVKAALEKQKAEMQAQVRAAVAASMAAEAWQPEKWQVEPKKKLDFFEMHGYFRGRGDAFVNFDLNEGTDPHGQPLFPRPAWSHANADTLATGNQRLRLDPTLNVSEDIQVKATVDVLDNLVWGSTPDTFPANPNTQTEPLLAFTNSAVPPEAGVNAAINSISVKRVWARIRTPVGVLRFGRMPSNWGLGVLTNDGNCLDCDYGDTVDRVMFVTKIGDYYVAPMLDTPATGPILQRQDTYQGQPFDLAQRDDVQQYVLAVKKYDAPEDINKMVLDGKVVVDYGLYNVLRVQNIAPKNAQIYNNGELNRSDFVLRNMWAYIPDAWVRVNAGKLRIEAEAVGVFGHIGNAANTNLTDAAVSVTQFGAVAQAEYKAVHDRLHLQLELGFASGDSAPGMGIRGAGLPVSAGTIDGPQYNVDPTRGPIDHTWNNFKFNRDYHVDLILWREILGQLTDAMYIKPQLSYDLTDTGSFSFLVSAIYSRTVFASSTPGNANDLGIEVDGTLRYKASDGFYAQAQYGILFPLAGLTVTTGQSPAIAQTVQGMLAVEF